MNDDLISRQAAKSKKVYSHERHEYVVPVAELDWLPSTQQEQKWVLVGEKLPEEGSEVLVTTSWNDVCKAWYSNGKWRAEFTNEYDDDEILAWMPLPKPYRKDDD